VKLKGGPSTQLQLCEFCPDIIAGRVHVQDRHVNHPHQCHFRHRSILLLLLLTAGCCQQGEEDEQEEVKIVVDG
jgi:hypothetical protein